MSGEIAPEWVYLLSDAGTQQLAHVAEQVSEGTSYLNISAALRKSGMPTHLIAPLLSQAELQQKARSKFGELASQLRFTPAGLEQASRAVVACAHAERFNAAKVAQVADLGCGIGAESIALLIAGVDVLPVEIDPLTAEIAAHNLAAVATHYDLTVPPVHLGAAEDYAVAPNTGVFLDPARRTAGHRDTRRITSPDDYSPSLTFAFGHFDSHPTGVKLGPGFDRELIPENAEAQWVSVDQQVVEMGVWAGPLARPGITRSALIIRGETAHELTAAADSADADVAELQEFLYEPDGAVIRARLIGLLAEQLSANMLSDGIAYMGSASLHHTPFAAAFQVLDVLPSNEKQLRKALSERNIGSLEIKKRGVDIDPAALRTRLRLKGTERATIVMTRIAGKHTTLLVSRCSPDE